ncbi:MAG: aminodeoxychorismate/anthranilate synthase component II [Bacteroidetes bacterium]|nr:MAG: aminodeoxychorismate/anthranilate synthase component II [Bacteroidota bacterium]
MKLLVLDNYDSFTYNLVHIVRELGYGAQMDIYRNDKIELEAVAAYDKILLSPGPGIPSEAGIMQQLIQRYAPSKQLLGVCLGHQGIAECFGAQLHNMEEVLHGVATPTRLLRRQDPIFQGLPLRFQVARYHSWTVLPGSMNGQLELLAEDENGLVMALRHIHYQVYGLQFHPESIITEHGARIMQNWLNM